MDKGQASQEAGRRSLPRACSEKGVAAQGLSTQGGGQRNGQDLAPMPDRGEDLGAGCWGVWEGGRGAGSCLQVLGPGHTPRSPLAEREGPAVHSLGPAVGPSTAEGPPAAGGVRRGLHRGRGGPGRLSAAAWLAGQSRGQAPRTQAQAARAQLQRGPAWAPPQVPATPRHPLPGHLQSQPE